MAAGAFDGAPRGVLLHGTRSGLGRSIAEEFAGTVNWAQSPANPLAWNWTIGEGVYAVHLPADRWGWHAREASGLYLAAEFAQARLGDAITDAQVAAFAAAFRREAAPRWPDLDPATMELPNHSETAPGRRDGKSDVYRDGDPQCEELRRRIREALRG